MGELDSHWLLIFGKPVSSASLVKAVSRGLVECLRSACVVTPSLQNLAFLALLETSLLQGLTSDAQSPPSKSVLPSPASTAEHAVPRSLSEDLSDKERSVFESWILVFVESVAAWTQEEKDQQRRLLSRTDIVRKRLAWAAKMKLVDFDVNNNEAECWEDMDYLFEPGDDEYYDPDDYEKNVQEDAKGALKQFEATIVQLSKALGGVISKKITYSNCWSWRATSSVLTIDSKIARGATYLGEFQGGTSTFKFKPEFFDVSPEDVLSLKFISNLLGLDDSTKVSDLQDSEQSAPHGYYGKDRREGKEVTEEHMKGNDPAWITMQEIMWF
jgi:hypothetical protein